MQQQTCDSLHVIVVVVGGWCLYVRWFEMTAAFEFFKCRGTVLGSRRLVHKRIVFTKRLTLEGISRSPHPGGYAGVRLGEARNPGPAEYERDHTSELHGQRTRMNEAGVRRELGPRSHDASDPETWRAGSHARQQCTAATAGSISMYGMRYYPVAPREPMRPLPIRHRDERSGDLQLLPRSMMDGTASSTGRPSGCRVAVRHSLGTQP